MIRPLPACLLGVALSGVAAAPVGAHSPDEALALVERAADHIREKGRLQAFADFNRPNGGFVDGDLFVFCTDSANVVLANGGNPMLVGKNMSAVRDGEGRLPAADLFRIAQTKGRGWYEYLWPNPVRRRIERKVAYAIRIDDKTMCAAGYYKPNSP